VTKLSFIACFAILTFGAAISTAAEITVEKSEAGAAVKIDGKLFTEYVKKSGTKPILWPIIGPTGKAMTRSWPMNADAPKSEKRDHPHHRSFWMTHGSVNGVDFWSEGSKAGKIVHREFTALESKPPKLVAIHDWQDRDGKKVCEEEQTLGFGAADARRWIDFTTVIKATEGPLTFGDTKEGAFGVRVSETMKVEAKLGGKIVNSEGQTDAAAWGKPAKWVDYHGPVEGETLGIAILDHPSSFRHPTTWHVRTYGLFAANPFGLHDFAGGDKNVDGKHTVEKGNALTLKYRVLFHKGDEKEGRVAEAFEEFAKGDD
jgi:hypothetical protein